MSSKDRDSRTKLRLQSNTKPTSLQSLVQLDVLTPEGPYPEASLVSRLLSYEDIQSMEELESPLVMGTGRGTDSFLVA